MIYSSVPVRGGSRGLQESCLPIMIDKMFSHRIPSILVDYVYLYINVEYNSPTDLNRYSRKVSASGGVGRNKPSSSKFQSSAIFSLKFFNEDFYTSASVFLSPFIIYSSKFSFKYAPKCFKVAFSKISGKVTHQADAAVFLELHPQCFVLNSGALHAFEPDIALDLREKLVLHFRLGSLPLPK